MLRATTACTFSTSQLPKVVRQWGALYILTWKCASRHNGVQFFISHLASWLRTRRFSEPTFRPSGASNHWKNTVLRDFPTFSRICIFFLLTLSLLLFSLLIFLFSLSLSLSALRCFSSVHIVRSLTSKLPSIISPFSTSRFRVLCMTCCNPSYPNSSNIWGIMIHPYPSNIKHGARMSQVTGAGGSESLGGADGACNIPCRRSSLFIVFSCFFMCFFPTCLGVSMMW